MRVDGFELRGKRVLLAGVLLASGGCGGQARLLRDLESPDDVVAIHAAEAIENEPARIDAEGAQRAIPLLLRLLARDNWQAKRAAIEALGSLGPRATAAVPNIEGFVSWMGDGSLGTHARHAIEAICAGNAAAECKSRSLP